MVRSVEGSLSRLQTDYIDLLYLHMWDGIAPVEEVLRGMDDLVRAGKVLYVGTSDIPAWPVSRMQAIAELRGWAPLIVLGVTNARSESLNRIAKLEARLAYSFRNPANQRRRVRMACTRSTRRSQNAPSHQSHPVTSRKQDPG